MATILEENLREAACIGDTEAVLALLSQNIDIDSQNKINGWTALHWACKRNNDEIARILLNHGADKQIQTIKGELPADICTSNSILSMLGENNKPNYNHHEVDNSEFKFTPNYIKNAPISGQVELGRIRNMHTDFSNMPTTILPASQSEDLILKIKLQGGDPDYIEIELPKWKLTYNNLLKTCCEELEVLENQVERIRKQPNTRLRNDNDVKRLRNFQELEIVLKSAINGDKANNAYQSISTKDQTILY